MSVPTPVLDVATYQGSVTNFNHTVADKPARILLVIGGRTDNKIITSVTGFTKLIDSIEDVNNRAACSIWYKLNPSVGVNSIVAAPNGAYLISASFYNVNQITPFGTPNTNKSTYANPTNTVTCLLNDLVLQVVAMYPGIANTWSDPASTVSSNANVNLGSRAFGAVGSQTINSDQTQNYASIGVSLIYQPISAGASATVSDENGASCS